MRTCPVQRSWTWYPAFTVLVLLLPVCLLLQDAHAWEAIMLHAHDGDTIVVAPRSSPDARIKVRLYGIDTPELRQDYGREATQAVREFLPTRAGLEIETFGSDRYNRVLACVHNLDTGRNVNEEMVRTGNAWVYTQYCKKPFCRRWFALQKEAAQKELGLWAEDDPVPPWIWRKQQRGGR